MPLDVILFPNFNYQLKATENSGLKMANYYGNGEENFQDQKSI